MAKFKNFVGSLNNVSVRMENKIASIDLEELRGIVNAIFDHLTKDLGISSVDLTENVYQEVPTSCLYEVGQESVVPDIGSLSDDLEFLLPLLGDRKQAVSLMFTHVAPLLRFIAQKVGQ